MPRSSTVLAPQELISAVGQLAAYLAHARAQYSISGGAASTLIRSHYGFPVRVTDDIDLVVQPTDTITAETISAWLLQSYPTAFIAKSVHGVPVPALRFQRSDGSVKNIEIEIFDVCAWPQRPQYDLSNPANQVVTIEVSGVEVPVFSAGWLLREHGDF